MALISGIAAVITLALKPLKVISKHVMYPFKVRKNVRSLQRLKNDVQNIIDENGKQTEEIKQWLADVKTIEEKAEKIQQKKSTTGRCLWSIPPNPWSNYKVSRSAAKKQEEMTSLCERRARIKEVIMQMPPPPAQQMPASSSKSPYLDSALADIKNDAQNIIGIWGMGGVGKTHLLEQINNELSRDDAFKVVVFVTCSKDCSEEKVQNEIIGKLPLNKPDSIEEKQQTIFDYLKQKSFVLLLDDLCKRRVVLTTRSTEVCGQMEVRKQIPVDGLNGDNAMALFKEKATEETINSDPLIQRFAVDIVKELGGLPLALITVGRAMYDKRDPSEWEHAIEQLKKACQDDVEEKVFKILKFSYDNLKNETFKQRFLHCSLWPEDHKIEKRDLVELWMGMGLIDEPSIHAAYNDGYSYIRRLQAVCLLETIGDGHTDRVKMHDVIRDMALWIANTQVEGKKQMDC